MCIRDRSEVYVATQVVNPGRRAVFTMHHPVSTIRAHHPCAPSVRTTRDPQVRRRVNVAESRACAFSKGPRVVSNLLLHMLGYAFVSHCIDTARSQKHPRRSGLCLVVVSTSG